MFGMSPESTADNNYWPKTRESLFSPHADHGNGRKQLCSDHLMRVYQESLVRFYVGCSGSVEFPKLPKRELHLSDREHADEVVNEYFAKRAENLVVKWLKYRSDHPEGEPHRLRTFIKQDFRFHCREMLRSDLRYHGRARELEPDQFEATSAHPEVQRETTQLELTGLVRLAVDLMILEYPEAERDQLRVLVENRILQQRPYKDFEGQLSWSPEVTRQKAFRFKKRFLPMLRDLIREHGDTVADLMEDLS